MKGDTMAVERDPEKVQALAGDLLDFFKRHHVDQAHAIEGMIVAIAAIIKTMPFDKDDPKLIGEMVQQMIEDLSD